MTKWTSSPAVQFRTAHHLQPQKHVISSMKAYRSPTIAFATSLVLSHLPAQAGQETITALKAMSISELMQVPVTSVSRRPQKIADTAAAVYVISQEDIRRSAAQSLPDLLRMVPGIQVAQIDSNKWAISARGFNGRYANKLLVQQDGRTLYGPTYSGVYWDVQNIPLANIERIEVIRGPGATLWGANAVNGIINIITRSSHDTQGSTISVRSGNERKSDVFARFGGEWGNNASYHLYAQGFKQDHGHYFNGQSAVDSWSDQRFGFRTDIDLNATDSLVVQGELYSGEAGAGIQAGPALLATESETSGGHLLTRWRRTLDANSGLELQFYYDRTERDNWSLTEDRDTLDIDFQHFFSPIERHKIVWGLGYRISSDEITPKPGSSLSFSPDARDLKTFNAFLQDEITLINDELSVILGSKFEHNDYTGWEIQPNLRAIWSINETTSIWGALSRAVRTPSRIESDVIIDSPSGTNRIYGNPNLDAESLTAMELGIRLQPTQMLSFDIAAFYNEYDQLQSFELNGPAFPLPFRLDFDNRLMAKSHGIEVAANWEVNKRWRIKASYSWLDIDFSTETGSSDTTSHLTWDKSPEHQLALRSMLDLSDSVQFDTSLYYVDELPNQAAPSYTRIDARLAWQVQPELEISLIGTNLLDNQHPEFAQYSGNAPGQGLTSTQIDRSLLLQLEWRF